MTTLRARCDELLENMSMDKSATLLTDVKAIASKLGVDYTALGPTLSACEEKHAQKGSSDAKGSTRKAVIVDLTQSDEDEPQPERARVEPTNDAALAATKPWETPEWKAKGAAARARPSILGAYCEQFDGGNMSKLMRGASDEERWREIHDPVGAFRMQSTRICQNLQEQHPSSTMNWDEHINKQVRDFARQKNLPYDR